MSSGFSRPNPLCHRVTEKIPNLSEHIISPKALTVSHHVNSKGRVVIFVSQAMDMILNNTLLSKDNIFFFLLCPSRGRTDVCLAR